MIKVRYLIYVLFIQFFFLSCLKERRKEKEIFFESGKRMTGYSIDEKKQGIWKIWDENNKIYGLGSFYNDKLDGNWLYYDKDGKLTESEFFINGLKHGRSYQYLIDGRVEYAMDFVNDTLNGNFIHYIYKENYIKYEIEYLKDNQITKQGKCYIINIDNCSDIIFNNRIGIGFDVLEVNPIRIEQQILTAQ